MQKIRTLSLIGVRAGVGQTLGSATNGVTMTVAPSGGIYFVPTGGDVTIRKDSELVAEAVTWAENIPFTAEGFRETMGASEWVPGLIVGIPAGVSVTGWVQGGQPVIA